MVASEQVFGFIQKNHMTARMSGHGNNRKILRELDYIIVFNYDFRVRAEQKFLCDDNSLCTKFSGITRRFSNVVLMVRNKCLIPPSFSNCLTRWGKYFGESINQLPSGCCKKKLFPPYDFGELKLYRKRCLQLAKADLA